MKKSHCKLYHNLLLLGFEYYCTNKIMLHQLWLDLGPYSFVFMLLINKVFFILNMIFLNVSYSLIFLLNVRAKCDRILFDVNFFSLQLL